MKRLNDRAFDILQTEIRRCTSSDLSGQVQQELALRRLEKLRLQPGTPLTQAELKAAIDDLLPNFDPAILRKAAKANRPPSPAWFWFKTGTFTVGSVVAFVWLANRPIPWVRYPVARTAPFLLTPSYMAMDHDYKSAIALVEQADQLVNKATAFEDLELGKQKVDAAQNHLNELPAWYLGHFPTEYCRWTRCRWRFTYDEFKTAREAIARMEARLFQEKNAQTRFEQAEQSIAEATQSAKVAQSEPERSRAMRDWQAAIDRLKQLPSETLAGHLAQKKLAAADREFEAEVGYRASTDRAGKLMQVARELAAAAKQQANSANPLPINQLEQIRDLWQDAIEKLMQIKDTDPAFVNAQRQALNYREELNKIETQISKENTSKTAYEKAQAMIAQLQSNADPTRANRAKIIGQLSEILIELNKVQPKTTVYAEAQTLKAFADNWQDSN